VLDPGIARTLPGPDEPNGMFMARAVAGAWGFVDAGHGAESPAGGFDLGGRHPDGVHYNEAGAERAAAAIVEYLRSAVG
jgi:lysophospholipase L1-like esterase